MVMLPMLQPLSLGFAKILQEEETEGMLPGTAASHLVICYKAIVWGKTSIGDSSSGVPLISGRFLLFLVVPLGTEVSHKFHLFPLYMKMCLELCCNGEAVGMLRWIRRVASE